MWSELTILGTKLLLPWILLPFPPPQGMLGPPGQSGVDGLPGERGSQGKPVST